MVWNATRRMAGVTRLTLAALLVGALSMLLVAPAAAEDMAKVRVVHASPDAPAVDIYVDGAVAVQGLEFGAATGYVDLPAGAHTFEVRPAGAAADSAAVITADATVDANSWYTIAAVGLLANIAPQIYVDNVTAPEAGKAHVRVIHASPDAPAVDVAVTGGPVLFSNLAFPNAAEYLPVDAGTYDLEVRPAGTTDVALAVPGVGLEAGTVYTVVAIGQLADSSLAVLPLVDATFDATGGGDPSVMPNTGAADGTNWALFIALGAAALLVAGGLALRFSPARARR